MKPAPIYLLIDGEASGPQEASDVMDKIDEEELAPETLSCIEGMPGWRSVSETLVWAYARLLTALPPSMDWIQQMSEHRLEMRELRPMIRKTLQQNTGLECWEAPDLLDKVFQANAYLLEHHRQYEAREQNWDLGATEFYPALELVAFGELQFPRVWTDVWQQAGGIIYGGKMAARIDDPVWLAISDFGYPFPPFSFDPTMWIQGVSREEAKKDSSRFIMGRDRAFRRRTRCESDSCESCGSLARWI